MIFQRLVCLQCETRNHIFDSKAIARYKLNKDEFRCHGVIPYELGFDSWTAEDWAAIFANELSGKNWHDIRYFPVRMYKELDERIRDKDLLKHVIITTMQEMLYPNDIGL